MQAINAPSLWAVGEPESEMMSFDSARTYHVPGISCAHCQKAIEREVRDLAGVVGVMVDVSARRVVVRGGASDAAVRDAIERAGYRVSG